MKQSNTPFYQKNFQQPAVAGGTTQPTKVPPWVAGFNQRINTSRMKFSQVNIQNPGTLSSIATALATIGAGSTSFVTDTLTPQTPHGTEMNFAIPYIAVYEGTAATPANQIYPTIGASKNYGSYTIYSDYDWNTFSTNTTPGSITSVYVTTIHNNMGASGTIFYVNQWKYLNLTSGTVV